MQILLPLLRRQASRHARAGEGQNSLYRAADFIGVISRRLVVACRAVEGVAQAIDQAIDWLFGVSYNPSMPGFKQMQSVNPHLSLTAVSLALLITLPLLSWSDSPAIAQGKNAPKMVWLKVGTGDCAGQDVGTTNGLTPDDKQAKAAYTAVCWDGRIYDHKDERGRVFCTYKNIAPDKCTGGRSTGIMYQAVAK